MLNDNISEKINIFSRDKTSQISGDCFSVSNSPNKKSQKLSENSSSQNKYYKQNNVHGPMIQNDSIRRILQSQNQITDQIIPQNNVIIEQPSIANNNQIFELSKKRQTQTQQEFANKQQDFEKNQQQQKEINNQINTRNDIFSPCTQQNVQELFPLNKINLNNQWINNYNNEDNSLHKNKLNNQLLSPTQRNYISKYQFDIHQKNKIENELIDISALHSIQRNEDFNNLITYNHLTSLVNFQQIFTGDNMSNIHTKIPIQQDILQIPFYNNEIQQLRNQSSIDENNMFFLKPYDKKLYHQENTDTPDKNERIQYQIKENINDTQIEKKNQTQSNTNSVQFNNKKNQSEQHKYILKQNLGPNEPLCKNKATLQRKNSKVVQKKNSFAAQAQEGLIDNKISSNQSKNVFEIQFITDSKQNENNSDDISKQQFNVDSLSDEINRQIIDQTDKIQSKQPFQQIINNNISDKHFYKAMQKIKEGANDDTKPPKKPASAYILYQKEKRAEILKRKPNQKVTEVVKEIAQCWQLLNKDDRLPYREQARKEKERYELQIRHLESYSKNLKKPKKCLSAYMIYVKETRPSIVLQYPELGALDIMKRVGEQWQNIINSKNQIKYFQDKADNDKLRYLDEQKDFYDEVNRIHKETKGIKEMQDEILNRVSSGLKNYKISRKQSMQQAIKIKGLNLIQFQKNLEQPNQNTENIDKQKEYQQDNLIISFDKNTQKILKKRKLSYNDKIKPLKGLKKHNDSSKYSESLTSLFKKNIKNSIIQKNDENQIRVLELPFSYLDSSNNSDDQQSANINDKKIHKQKFKKNLLKQEDKQLHKQNLNNNFMNQKHLEQNGKNLDLIHIGGEFRSTSPKFSENFEINQNQYQKNTIDQINNKGLKNIKNEMDQDNILQKQLQNLYSKKQDDIKNQQKNIQHEIKNKIQNMQEDLDLNQNEELKFYQKNQMMYNSIQNYNSRFLDDQIKIEKQESKLIKENNKEIGFQIKEDHCIEILKKNDNFDRVIQNYPNISNINSQAGLTGEEILFNRKRNLDRNIYREDLFQFSQIQKKEKYNERSDNIHKEVTDQENENEMIQQDYQQTLSAFQNVFGNLNYQSQIKEKYHNLNYGDCSFENIKDCNNLITQKNNHHIIPKKEYINFDNNELKELTKDLQIKIPQQSNIILNNNNNNKQNILSFLTNQSNQINQQIQQTQNNIDHQQIDVFNNNIYTNQGYPNYNIPLSNVQEFNRYQQNYQQIPNAFQGLQNFQQTGINQIFHLSNLNSNNNLYLNNQPNNQNFPGLQLIQPQQPLAKNHNSGGITLIQPQQSLNYGVNTGGLAGISNLQGQGLCLLPINMNHHIGSQNNYINNPYIISLQNQQNNNPQDTIPQEILQEIKQQQKSIDQFQRIPGIQGMQVSQLNTQQNITKTTSAGQSLLNQIQFQQPNLFQGNPKQKLLVKGSSDDSQKIKIFQKQNQVQISVPPPPPQEMKQQPNQIAQSDINLLSTNIQNLIQHNPQPNQFLINQNEKIQQLNNQFLILQDQIRTQQQNQNLFQQQKSQNAQQYHQYYHNYISEQEQIIERMRQEMEQVNAQNYQQQQQQQIVQYSNNLNNLQQQSLNLIGNSSNIQNNNIQQQLIQQQPQIQLTNNLNPLIQQYAIGGGGQPTSNNHTQYVNSAQQQQQQQIQQLQFLQRNNSLQNL